MLDADILIPQVQTDGVFGIQMEADNGVIEKNPGRAASHRQQNNCCQDHGKKGFCFAHTVPPDFLRLLSQAQKADTIMRWQWG